MQLYKDETWVFISSPALKGKLGLIGFNVHWQSIADKQY
jgi:hypothetical protein